MNVLLKHRTISMTNSTLPPRTLILTPRLVVRESCRAYLNQNRVN